MKLAEAIERAENMISYPVGCDTIEAEAIQILINVAGEACLYYHADGTSEQLDSPEEVKTRRIEAAKQIDLLAKERDQLRIKVKNLEDTIANYWIERTGPD